MPIMRQRWNPYYRSSNGFLVKTNKEIGRLLYGVVFLSLFAVGFKFWGLSVGLVVAVLGNIAYAAVWFFLKSIRFWDH